MAGYLRSAMLLVEPGRQYLVTAEIRIEGLEVIDARLTGAPYVFFWDERLLPGSYQPITGRLAARAGVTTRNIRAATSGH